MVSLSLQDVRHSYDNSKINQTISQVENLQQTCDRSYDAPRTYLKIFSKSVPRIISPDHSPFGNEQKYNNSLSINFIISQSPANRCNLSNVNDYMDLILTSHTSAPLTCMSINLPPKEVTLNNASD